MNYISQKINAHIEEVQERNRKNFLAMTVGGCLICGAISVIGLLMAEYTEFVLQYICFFAYMLVVFIIAKICDIKKVKHISLIYYCAITPLMIGGIMMGTFWDPANPALTIMLFLNILTLFIIDKPQRMLIYIVSIGITFTICCYLSKEPKRFIADMVDLLIFGCIALGINFFMLRMNVENVENFCKAKYQSERDSLTNLFNRGTGEKQTRQHIENRRSGAFLIIDIDNFKNINDKFGHQVGDQAICAISDLLRKSFHNSDVIFRLGGDEFAVFALGMTDKDSCQAHLERIEEEAKEILTSNDKCSSVGLSIGCTIYCGAQVDFEEIYNSSDSALYQAKENGKGQYVIKKR